MPVTFFVDTPVIECRNVSKVFDSQGSGEQPRPRSRVEDDRGRGSRRDSLVAVNNVSFRVERGKTLCIMGLSGCGKSTLLRLVNRLIVPTAGEVFIDGADLSKMTPSVLKDFRNRRVGMVFQSYGLFPHLTVMENVAFPLEVRGVGRSARMQIALDKLDLVGLGARATAYPEELSGGMKQRVGIARVLASDADIFLMDEPFSALDPLMRRELQDEFVGISKEFGKTVVFVTHDFEEALRIGDEMAIMRDGEFVQIGPPEAVIENPTGEFVARFVKIASERA